MARDAGLLRSVALATALILVPCTSQAKSPRITRGGGHTNAGWFVAGVDGTDYALPGGIKLHLAPGTRVRIPEWSQKLPLLPGHSTRTWSVALDSGHVNVRVPRQHPGSEAVLVSTPRRLGVIALAGNVAAVGDARGAAVANMDGQALVSSGSMWRALAPGKTRVATHQGAIEAEALLPPPELALPHMIWLSPGATTDLDGLRWKSVHGATGYEVELLRDGVRKKRATTPADRRHVDVSAVAPGSYVLAVRAIDESGLEGRAARTTLHVIGVALPAGAYTDASGVIRLGRGQKASFTHAEGLEMTYSGAHQFFDAPRPIGLKQGRRTLVLLRVPGTDDTVTARLDRRELQVETHMGPKWAMWPLNPIDISVRLHQADGSAKAVKLVPRVTLGTTPIDVEWHRDGNVLRARVPPRSGRGPWVLRLDVSDQYGIPLAHDFVEIVAAPRRIHVALH